MIPEGVISVVEGMLTTLTLLIASVVIMGGILYGIFMLLKAGGWRNARHR